MKAAGITLSTVGAGGGANPFLEQLAKDGGGRFYAAANPASIPDIFLKETQQVSGQQIVEETFFPILTSSSPILRGIEGGLPQLLGYNGTTAKPAAQTVLVTARDDPLLAQWQYGLGRSVAWTSDSTGRWAKSWIGWNGLLAGSSARWWAGRSRARRAAASRRRSWTAAGGRTCGSRASTPTARRATSTPRAWRSSDRTSSARPWTCSQVAPGVYEAPVASLQSGAYAVRVTQTKPGEAPLGPDAGPGGADAPPSTGCWAPTSRSSPRSGPRPAATLVDDRRRRLAARPADHRAATPTSGRGCWCWRCCCGRWTSPCGASRWGAGSWPTAGAGSRDRLPRPARGRADAGPSEGMLAARDRAGSAGARSGDPARGLGPRRGPDADTTASPGAERRRRAASPASVADAGRRASAAPPPPPPTTAAPPAPAAPPATPGASDDTLARLRDAKRRNRS